MEAEIRALCIILVSVALLGCAYGVPASVKEEAPSFSFENVKVIADTRRIVGGSVGAGGEQKSVVDEGMDDEEGRGDILDLRGHPDGQPQDEVDISIIAKKIKGNITATISNVNHVMEYTAENANVLFMCDFERGDCMIDMGLTFSFVRTQASKSGGSLYKPSSDVNGLLGHYTMVDLTGQRDGIASIRSPYISQTDGPGTYCLSFWYAMQGKSVGTLGLYFFFRNDDNGKLGWAEIGNHGSFWFKKTITFRTTRRFDLLLVFVVSQEETGSGTIAVDEIQVSKGRCKGACSRTRITPVFKKVVGGIEARPHSWPWQVRLMRTDRSDYLCGGVVINSRHILTAAHCVIRPNEDQGLVKKRLRAITGDHDIYIPETYERVYEVETIKDHENYFEGRHNNRHDIAVLRTKTSIAFNDHVQPVCLPTRKAPITHCIATGWGYTNSVTYSWARFLRQVRVLTMKHDTCQLPQLHGDRIYEEMICAAHPKGGRDTCLGDSGGPLVCRKRDSDPWILYGLTSWGNMNCGEAEKPGVYTRVYYHINWIRNNTRI